MHQHYSFGKIGGGGEVEEWQRKRLVKHTRPALRPDFAQVLSARPRPLRYGDPARALADGFKDISAAVLL